MKNFIKEIDQVMKEQSALYRELVPYGGHLIGVGSNELDTNYYLQYRIDDVHKIWGTASTDSLALSQLVKIDYKAARFWGEYTVEEMGHDRLFLADLNKHGISKEQVSGLPTLSSTKDILDFLENDIRENGPLAALAYSIYLEWNSENDAAKTVELARAKFGDKFVKGSYAHLGIDEKENHLEMVIDVAYKISEASGGESLFALLRKFGELFRNYYTELYETTVQSNTAPVYSLNAAA